MICDRCGWPRGDGCTCPADQETARALLATVRARHRAAVELARLSDRRRRNR